MLRYSLAILTLLLATVLVRAGAAAPLLASEDEQSALRAAAARVADSVVQIRTIGGLEEVDDTQLPTGPTTGLVISADGWIVSSAFNFVQSPASIIVTFSNGEQAPARLVAKDHSRMLVLLKAQGVDELSVPEFVPSADVHVGEWAVAVGRTFRTDRTNVSIGIVSALRRMFGKVIQTDADVSAANYGGPLIDIRGRVLGVVVPIAPQSTSEVAGAEWYDSGIGFAVPIADIGPAIERMKTGQDQRAGVLGVSLTAENPHESPATIIAVLPNSPAGTAGLRKDDRIVEIDGQPIRTQTEMRFALGSRYAGEEVGVTVARGDKRIQSTLKLAGELELFRHAFLGILPMRDDVEAADESSTAKTAADETAESEDAAKSAEVEKQEAAGKASDKPDPPSRGVTVRFVFPGSPAEGAGIRPGDRMVRIDDTDVASIGQAIAAMNAKWPETPIAVRVLRDNKPLDLVLTAARLPTSVPGELPSAHAAATSPLPAEAAKGAAAGPRDLKLAEFTETCKVYVPPSHDAGRPAGILLWLHAPNDPPNDALFVRWKPICDRDGLILVAPTAADPTRWERTELEYLRKLTERALHEYRVDRQRVVVYGQGGGGAMAYMLALMGRDVFRGVAVPDVALPRNVRVPPNEPAARLAVFAGLPADASRLAQVNKGLQKLAEGGYPITPVTIASSTGQLSDAELQELARWIDSLDRF